MNIFQFLISIFFAFLAVYSFSILFNVPKSELFICGILGAISWIVYLVAVYFGANRVLGTFISAFISTFVGRIFSYRREKPFILFVIAGILTSVPGTDIYNTMYLIVINETKKASSSGLETIKLASVIALSILLTLSIPHGFFKIFRKKNKT